MYFECPYCNAFIPYEYFDFNSKDECLEGECPNCDTMLHPLSHQFVEPME